MDADAARRYAQKILVCVINGTQPKVRDLLYTGYKDCQRSVRDDRWKLIRYPLVNKTQIFDLHADPCELNDLADEPESADKIQALTALLEKTCREYSDDTPLQVDNFALAVGRPLQQK